MCIKKINKVFINKSTLVIVHIFFSRTQLPDDCQRFFLTTKVELFDKKENNNNYRLMRLRNLQHKLTGNCLITLWLHA